MHHICEKIDSHDADIARSISETYHISRSTVYNYIHKLAENGIIEKKGE